MRDAPLLSLIVPTRDRAQTLAYTLATAVAQKSRNYEIVVSDNASADNTRAVVCNVADDRIRYFNTNARLSMCANYEFAVERAKGDYVLIIGDDDAVIPGKLDFLLGRLAQLSQPMIHTWPLHVYDWPVGSKAGHLTYLAGKAPPFEVDLKRTARLAVARGGWKYYALPSPYHSAVPRSLLQAIRDRTGKIFHSTQPDVFTAMALPAFADRAFNINESISFNGRSASSNGLGFVDKAAAANIDKFIREYGDYKFHPSLYPGVSGRANMIPDAVLVARHLFPELYADVRFGYGAMWAYIARLRFVAHAEVLRQRQQIQEYHKFDLDEFFYYSAVHEASAARRTILNAVSPKQGLGTRTPDNIFDFAKLLA